MSSFQDPSLPLSSYVLNFYTHLTLDIQFQTNPPPSPNGNQITNHWKENIIQGWLLYIIRSFLQVSFCFHYQLINLVWLSIDFFPFSWSQPRPQSWFIKLKPLLRPLTTLSWSLTICFFVGLYSCVQLSENMTKCFLFIIVHIFSIHFVINLFYLHILKT